MAIAATMSPRGISSKQQPATMAIQNQAGRRGRGAGAYAGYVGFHPGEPRPLAGDPGGAAAGGGGGGEDGVARSSGMVSSVDQWSSYWMSCVQLVVPAGSTLTMLFSLEQKPLSPDLP